MGFEDVEEIVPGVGGFVRSSTVDEDGALAGGGDFKLGDELFALDGVRRAFVVVVEADLSTGDDFGLGREGCRAGRGPRASACGVVWG